MEYSDLVKKKADALVLRFSRHLADVSLFSTKGTEYANTKDNGAFAFDLSKLSEKERRQVLSLASETLKFNYLFKVSKPDTNKVRYLKTISGFHPKVLKTALFITELCAWVIIVTGFILLIKRVFEV